MATLSTILSTKYQAQASQGLSDAVETGTGAVSFAETGEIYMYVGNPQLPTRASCWIAPSAGTAVIEAWGPGGSGAGGCCCGTGGPANPGAYSKKTVTVETGDSVCLCTGCSYRPDHGVFCSTQSDPTRVVICTTANGCECMCAEGGWGSCWACGDTTSAFCCLGNATFYNGSTVCGGCGIICHCCCAFAYGGDINCYGDVTCVYYRDCGGSRITLSQQDYYVAFPPGLINNCGGRIYFTAGSECTNHSPSLKNYIAAIKTLESQSSSQQSFGRPCWTGAVACGCYEATTCQSYLPPGFPGIGGEVNGGERTVGLRGGPGAVRITFVGS